MPNPEKKSRVRFTYLVATRILRSCLSRNAVATSSRSAMLRTSIQACGTATTTLAWPKPSASISTTWRSASGIISRTRSSPVRPRCTAPCASMPTIPAAESGGEAHARDVDAAGGEKAGTALEPVERGVERDLVRAREGAQLGRGLVGIAADAQEFFDQRAGLPRQRGLRAERRLLEKAV